ncbi:helix-turn-helix domain-containing protein [Phytoactinopolyspora halotolerans]|uniref:Helix-turn-helix domain-containing protein n=1 Tax=Phytoactinopolyspora halotolerans TaxID=1981512 RepID=A0A6L9SGD0_9ACTN|nr:helix-turn-helix domain-containing protein [Phytoactinopolyspora halotolerans]NEE03694.1 helix-turn-helix domain-containing protein [Phytoactinopolyspora halotolerans]
MQGADPIGHQARELNMCSDELISESVEFIFLDHLVDVGRVMDWSDPSTAVMSRSTAAVLRSLAGSDRPISVRQLARLADISQTRARQVVIQLSEHGMVTVEAEPGVHLVRLNRDHVATDHAVALATLRSRVMNLLRGEFAGWHPPALHASLYGSAARGDGSTSSDIDILVVHEPLAAESEQEEWDDQLARSGQMIYRWTGNWASWFQVSEAELGQMVSSEHSLIAEWRRDAITLVGSSFPTLLRRVR